MAGVWVAKSKTDVEIGPKNQTPEFWGIQEKRDAKKAVRTPERQFGHLLGQNLSQEVQEHFWPRGKARKPYKKLKNEDFGVSGVWGGISTEITGDLPLKAQGICW